MSSYRASETKISTDKFDSDLGSVIADAMPCRVILTPRVETGPQTLLGGRCSPGIRPGGGSPPLGVSEPWPHTARVTPVWC